MPTSHVVYQNSFVYYTEDGRGKTLVLLHGFGEDGKVWQSQIDFLQPHFHIIVPDIPGSGKSTFIQNANIDTYAEIIKLILDNEAQKFPLQVEEGTALIGHSMGGYIALAFAEKYPQYLNCFGLFHSTAFADSEEKKRTRRNAIDFIKENGAGSFLKITTPTMFATSFAEQYPDKIKDLIEEGKTFSDEALIQYYQAMIERPDRTAILKKINTPVLFLIGELDKAISLQNSLQQCYLPNQSYVNILAQSAHMGMWEETETTNNILFNFLIANF